MSVFWCRVSALVAVTGGLVFLIVVLITPFRDSCTSRPKRGRPTMADAAAEINAGLPIKSCFALDGISERMARELSALGVTCTASSFQELRKRSPDELLFPLLVLEGDVIFDRDFAHIVKSSIGYVSDHFVNWLAIVLGWDTVNDPLLLEHYPVFATVSNFTLPCATILSDSAALSLYSSPSDPTHATMCTNRRVLVFEPNDAVSRDPSKHQVLRPIE